MPGTSWWVDTGGFGNAPGSAVVGGGGDTSVVTPRDPLDAARMAQGLAPGSAYPDGYLGTITDRQQDKLLGAVQGRLTERSYQRGVHMGEKLGRDQYYWTADCNPQAGLERQAATTQPVFDDGAVLMYTERHVPTGNPVEKLTAMGESAGMPPEQQMQVAKQYGVDPAKNPLPMTMTNPTMAAEMAQWLPRYR